MEPLRVFLGRNKLTSDKGEKLCIWIWVQAQLARAQFYEADILYGEQFAEMVGASLHRVLRMFQIWVCTSRSWISPQQTQMVGAALMKKNCVLKKREESSTGLSSKNEWTKTPDIFFPTRQFSPVVLPGRVCPILLMTPLASNAWHSYITHMIMASVTVTWG